MSNLLMFDSISPGALPSGYSAYAGYVGGSWPDYAAEVARFPNAEVFSIAVNSSEDADFLDVEKGDATNANAPAWYQRRKAAGVNRPGFYTSVSNAAALLATLANAGVVRANIRLWTAHYNYVSHICSPSCFAGMPTTADGTQWTDQALGGSCDESTISPTFSDTPPTPFSEEEDMPLYATTSNGTGWVIATDLSSKTGMPDAQDAAVLLQTGLYKNVNLTDQLIDAIPTA